MRRARVWAARGCVAPIALVLAAAAGCGPSGTAPGGGDGPDAASEARSASSSAGEPKPDAGGSDLEALFVTPTEVPGYEWDNKPEDNGKRIQTPPARQCGVPDERDWTLEESQLASLKSAGGTALQFVHRFPDQDTAAEYMRVSSTHDRCDAEHGSEYTFTADAGLGEESYYSTAGTLSGEVQARTGEVVVSILLVGEPVTADMELFIAALRTHL